MSGRYRRNMFSMLFISSTLKYFLSLVFSSALWLALWIYTTPEVQPVEAALLTISISLPLFIAGETVFWAMLFVVREKLSNHDGTINWKILIVLMILFLMVFALAQLLFREIIYNTFLPQ